MSTIAELIDRLEKATGPSRELEAHIRRALLCPPDAYVEQSPFNGAWCIYRGEHNGRPRLFEMPYKTPLEVWRGEYTASIDAAVALAEHVLPGWQWTLSRHGKPTCSLNDFPLHKPAYPSYSTDVVHISVPVALTIAVLRAKEAMAT